jgi:hypothetical protein
VRGLPSSSACTPRLPWKLFKATLDRAVADLDTLQI